MGFIECENLVKIYKIADLEVVALQGLNLLVEQGEVMALVGPSGSGKSTLMNILGGLDTPSAGKVQVGEHDLAHMTEREQVVYRRREVGFVWQQASRNLLPYLTAIQNVELPMALNGVTGRERRQRAAQLLEQVGLADRLHHPPNRLSGGQQQRVAIAVAMANRPSLLLADEPTGQVDTESAVLIYENLRRMQQEYRVTVIIVTHDAAVANRVDRVVQMQDGRTIKEMLRAGESHDEFTILDRGGWIQLPPEYVTALHMNKHVQVELRDGHLVVHPAKRVD